MSADQYDDIIRRLDAAGSGTPAGRLYHVRDLTRWNDHPSRQAADVHALLTRAHTMGTAELERHPA